MFCVPGASLTRPSDAACGYFLPRADECARKGRRHLAAVAGQHRAHEVERQNVASMQRVRLEILGVDGWPDGIHVTAQNAARELGGDEQTLAARRRNGMVHRVVTVRWRDRAGLDTNQGVRPVDALEVDVSKILGGGARTRDGAGIVEAV